MKKCFIALALAIFLYGLMTPALSISLSYNAENNGKIVSSSSTYMLDKSTSLKESAILGDGKIARDLTASGSGNNRILIASSASGRVQTPRWKALETSGLQPRWVHLMTVS